MNQQFYNLNRGQVIDFLVDSLGYSYEQDLADLSTDEIFDLVPESEYYSAILYNKYGVGMTRAYWDAN